VLHLERAASPPPVRAAENAHYEQRQKKPSEFASRAVLEASGLLAPGFQKMMRDGFLMRIAGSVLALRLAKSGSEAMIAVDPKGETNWRCRRRRRDRRGLRDTPARLKISGLISLLRSWPTISATAAIRHFCKDEQPTPLVLFFLDAPAKAQAKSSKEAFRKVARTIVMRVMGCHKRPIHVVE